MPCIAVAGTVLRLLHVCTMKNSLSTKAGIKVNNHFQIIQNGKTAKPPQKTKVK